MKILIYFAAQAGLPVTFEDNDGIHYTSRADFAIFKHRFSWALELTGGGPVVKSLSWKDDKAKFYEAVKQRIGVEALWNRNTVRNYRGPQPGDLVIRYGGGNHHAALVYAVYPPGAPHPKQKYKDIPDFPGDSQAIEEFHQTEYFRGTVGTTGATAYRQPDHDFHFDYLNSRSKFKRNAEILYYANADQFLRDGFEFRAYAPGVLDLHTDA